MARNHCDCVRDDRTGEFFGGRCCRCNRDLGPDDAYQDCSDIDDNRPARCEPGREEQ